MKTQGFVKKLSTIVGLLAFSLILLWNAASDTSDVEVFLSDPRSVVAVFVFGLPFAYFVKYEHYLSRKRDVRVSLFTAYGCLVVYAAYLLARS